MHSFRRSARLFLAMMATFALFSWIGSVRAQTTAVPSQDQIDLFRSLSPEQQDAILQQLGIGGGLGGLGGGFGGIGGLGGLGSDRQGQQERQRQARESDQDRTQRSDEEAEPRTPVLKAEDWVIIEVDFHLAPRAPALAGYPEQGAQAGQSAQAMQAQGAAAAAAAAANSKQDTVAAVPTTNGPATDAQMSDEQRNRLKELIDLIRSKNPYQLTRDGALVLPGFAPMPLLGLTEEQATLRLKVEPALRDLDIRLTRLPLKKTGVEGLKPFGYDLFDRSPSTFAPVTNVPVPADYIIGPGDELNVQLYGNQNRDLRLFVQRDGRVNFPELGPINVGGQLFSAVKSNIESRISRQMIGVRGSVSMGDTRSIRVFVLGEARHPGSYTISGLGTVTSALYAAGGVRTIGSLRRIELKRQGALVRELDLYDLLIRGDTTNDTKLLQGDVIFIPPVGSMVAVDGEVHRPAIYEIKQESTVVDVVRLAGGLTAQADSSSASLTRIDEQSRRIVLKVDLSSGAPAQDLRNGDLLRIPRLRPTLDSGIVVQGHVYSPGNFAFRQGIRLSDVIRSVDDLRPDADIHYVLIRRELPPDRRIAVLSADLSAALQNPEGRADVPLMPRDQITVFDLASGRDRIIQPVLDELRLQSNSAHPTEVVHVAGRVKVPGEYPMEPGMTVADLIRAGGGLSDAAYGSQAELARYEIVDGQVRRTQLVTIDLSAALRGDPSANILLNSFDDLTVKEVPQWTDREAVTLIGEVRFPGRYVIRRGETLKSVVARAGGLTDSAFPQGSVFTREELKKREQEQMDMLATRMQTDLAALALEGAAANQAGTANALTVGQSLMAQLHASKAVGRLVIDLPKTLRAPAGSPSDVVLRDGDQLIIPKIQQQVTVIGEVQSATSHLYTPGLSRDDYIGLSGGTTQRADRHKIYVVRADGSVVAKQGSRWFQSGSDVQIKPGDTVVVPLDTERMPPLPFWQAVTSIIYNVAIAAAAVHSF